MTGEELNRFMKAAGPEFSIWRIPGGGTPSEIWKDWNGVEWDFNFCELTDAPIINENKQSQIHPTVIQDQFTIESTLEISHMDNMLFKLSRKRILNNIK